MFNINYKKEKCKEENASVWLISVLQYAQKLNFFDHFKDFILKMKTVRYSVYQKLVILMMSIIAGCETTKDINEDLKKEKLGLNMFGMETCPDQSQINELIRRFDEESINQFKEIHHTTFKQNSNCIYCQEDLVVDCDQTGLIANGKSYEISKKGYFSKRKNQSGYQLLVAFTGGECYETVGMHLDSGNTHCSKNFNILLKSIIDNCRDKLKSNELILRMDSGFGTSEIIEKLQSIKNLKFVVKGYNPKSAKEVAKTIHYSEFKKVANGAWVYELKGDMDSNLRYILVRTLSVKGSLKYSLLITNIGKEEKSAEELFQFYNERQTIEAFFKMAKNVYHIKNLRTTKFYGIYGFLWLVFITHNLMSSFRKVVLEDTKLEKMGMKVLIKKIGKIKGFVKRMGKKIEVIIPPLTELAEKIADVLINPKYEQLSMF